MAAHEKKTDRVTSWWRGISLRAKVTGVTVAVLTIGLFASGIGTMIFLRNAQIAERDQSLSQTVTTDLASSLLDVEVVDGVARFERRDASTLSPFFIAVYGADGTLLATDGPSSTVWPDFPETVALDEPLMRGTAPFELTSEEGTATFHASVDTLQIAGARELNVQLLALPLAPVNQTVANFIGIYTALGILTVLLGALTTRLLVTLTFRGLGQVETTAMSIAAGDFTQRMTDISPRTEVGRLKTAINAMLDRVDQALGQRDASVQQMRRFIGDASHELRTPLVTVRGYAELYRMGAISGPEQTAQSMERIEKEAIRMGVLVEDLLALARLDERRDIVVTAVDLRPVAQDAALDARVTAPERAVTYIDTTTLPTRKTADAAAAGGAPPGAPRRRAGRAPPARAPRSRCSAVVPAPDRTSPPRPAWPSRNRSARWRRWSPTTSRPSSWATRTASARWSRTSSATRAATRRPDRPSRSPSVSMSAPAWAGSRSATTARASPNRSATRSSSASGAPTRRGHGRPAAPGSACRSWRRSSTRCTAPSRSPRRRAAARRSASRCRSRGSGPSRSTCPSRRSRSRA